MVKTEGTNRTLEEMLRHYSDIAMSGPSHEDRDVHLDMAEFAINDAWQKSMQQTPIVLNYGQHALNFFRPGNG